MRLPPPTFFADVDAHYDLLGHLAPRERRREAIRLALAMTDARTEHVPRKRGRPRNKTLKSLLAQIEELRKAAAVAVEVFLHGSKNGGLSDGGCHAALIAMNTIIEEGVR